jgi:ABC-type uncharacterized transport system permease subunit
MQNSLYLISALLYLGCAFAPSRWALPVALGTAAAWLAHGATLLPDLLFSGTVRVGFALMLSATFWILVAAYGVAKRYLSIGSLRVLVFPSAALAGGLPYLFPGSLFSLQDKSVFLGLHIAISVLAYSTLTMAAFHAVLMAVQESRLHGVHGVRGGGGGGADSATHRGHWFWLAVERLPPLLKMERWLFRLVSIGFVLLGLTVLSGLVFSEQFTGKALRWDHKAVFALLSWLLFGALLLGRYWRGWRGRTALNWTLAGFLMLVLAYVGSHFVMEVILHRGGI